VCLHWEAQHIRAAIAHPRQYSIEHRAPAQRINTRKERERGEQRKRKPTRTERKRVEKKKKKCGTQKSTTVRTNRATNKVLKA
jgi:hypothetical protein